MLEDGPCRAAILLAAREMRGSSSSDASNARLPVDEPGQTQPPFSYAALATAGAALFMGAQLRFHWPLDVYQTTAIALATGAVLLAWAVADLTAPKKKRGWRERPTKLLVGSGVALALAAIWELPALEVQDSTDLAARNDVRMSVITALGGASLLFTWWQAERRNRLEVLQANAARLELAAANLESASEIKRTTAVFQLVELLDGTDESTTLVSATLGAFVKEALSSAPVVEEGLLPAAPASVQTALGLLEARYLSDPQDYANIESLSVNRRQVPRLVGLVLVLAELRESAFPIVEHCVFRACTLLDVTLRAIWDFRFKEGTVVGGNLEGAVLRDARFDRVEFLNVPFTSISTCEGVRFVDCTFVDCLPPIGAECEGCSARIAGVVLPLDNGPFRQ